MKITPANRSVTMSIGQLARQAGVSIDTVRYYERNRLLTPDDRSPAGYRRFGELQLSRLRFVKRAQALGFSLREIESLLELSAKKQVSQVKRSAQEKLADVEARIADLRRVQVGLKRLIEACPGHGSAADCPILRALNDERPPQ